MKPSNLDVQLARVVEAETISEISRLESEGVPMEHRKTMDIIDAVYSQVRCAFLPHDKRDVSVAVITELERLEAMGSTRGYKDYGRQRCWGFESGWMI